MKVSKNGEHTILEITHCYSKRAYFNILERDGMQVYEDMPFIWRTDDESDSIAVITENYKR